MIADAIRAAIAAGRLGGGHARIGPGGEVEAMVAGRMAPDGPALTDPGLRLRMASISKAATARAACVLAGEGLDLAAPVPGLGTVTLAMLLDHTSGLTDRAGYIPERGESPLAFVAARPDAVSGRPPGTFFDYANLNYMVAGAVLEAATGERFDVLVRRLVLAPAGIGGGFNWAGVAPADRALRLGLWQRQGDRLVATADGPEFDADADAVWRDRGVSLAGYVPGRDTTLLSPHAGLRMSVIEAARLARLFGEDSAAGRLQRRARWRWDAAARNGEPCGGLFPAFGLGLTFFGNRLVGHAGNALGFAGGAWHDLATGVSHAWFLTGGADLTAEDGREAPYPPEERAIMERLAGGGGVTRG